ncbi:Ff.00g102350.m01.CDS01 [Fusarium sp. VM40]|nr:Ff.00g102350.m01.CDS01 [Fusarium sp. VM40]
MSVPSPAPTDQSTTGVTVSPETIFQVGEDGDIMLVVGPNKVKIQVFSSFLKYISPVFRAMLDSPMSEGEAFRNRVNNSPIEIILPEDNARAMSQMLRGLYGVGPSCPHTKSDVRRVVILADKYDMMKQLKYFGVYWMRALGSVSGPTSLQCQWDILITAYMLKEDNFFFFASKAITKTKGSLLKYAMSTHDRELGLRLGMAIEEVRGVVKSFKGLEMGVCLDCFIQSTDSFTKKLDKCKSTDKHFNPALL